MIKIISILFLTAAVTGCTTSKPKTKPPMGDLKIKNKVYENSYNSYNSYNCPYSSLDEFHRKIYYNEKNH